MEFTKVDFRLRFLHSIPIDTYPTFVIRSTFGAQLRRMVCVFPGRPCDECELRHTCAYGFVFESPKPRATELLPGRNRVSHPFVLSTSHTVGERVQQLDFSLTLFGKGIDYLPYFYWALLRRAEIGLFRNNTPFRIVRVAINDNEVEFDEEHIDVERATRRLEIDGHEDDHERMRQIRIELRSPVRLKFRGHYGTEFDFASLYAALVSRLSIMHVWYDRAADRRFEMPLPQATIVDRRLHWLDLHYYSHRQKHPLRLGGAVGSITVQGLFSPQQMRILEAAPIIHIGKSTSFGLGQVAVQREEYAG